MNVKVLGRGSRKWESRFASWVRKADRNHFYGFFSDKTITVKITSDEPLFRKDKYMYACCVPHNLLIIVNPIILTECIEEEVEDTIRHELLHIFILFCYKDGDVRYNDDSRTFKKWSKAMNCPIKGRRVNDQKIDVIGLPFTICGCCGVVTKTKWCVCGSDWFKTYGKV